MINNKNKVSMSHVVVGERIAGAAPQIAGHIIVGAGHLAETIGGWFQTGAPNVVIPLRVQGSINDLSSAVVAEQWQWQKLNSNFGSGVFSAEDRAYKESLQKINFSMFPEPVDCCKGLNFEMAKNPTLAYGLDMHYDGPGGEAEQVREHYRDTQNKEAFDRVQNGSDNPRDQQRANDWARDHSA